MSADVFVKDPGDRTDYVVDYEEWLDGDTVSSVSWTIPAGLTQYASSNTTTAATLWLTGGTHGQDHIITCQATTAGGRIKQRSFKIMVRNDIG